MKTIKFMFCMLALVLIALASCSDDNDVDLSNRKFVRINQSSFYLTVGEKLKVTSTVDEIAGDSYRLVWSVLDANVATAESLEDNSGMVTALAPGNTILKVETADKKLMYFADLTVTKDPKRVYIDFGPIESPAPFNNYRFPTDPALESMVDEKGRTTPLSIVVEKGFTGVLERGLDNTLGFPRTASEDMFFSDGIAIPVSSFKMSGLTKGEKYKFTFYGHINDSNTQTEFRVIGANEGVAYLVNDFNPDRVAIVRGIEAAEDGTVSIELQPGPDNTQWAKFFGVNAMMVEVE